MNNTLAIVVTYNRCEMLEGCIKALKAQTALCDILIVDNASTDDTVSRVQPFLDEGTFFLRLDENIGGAGGFNNGLRCGVEHGYLFFWLMDDDARPEPDALQALLMADEILDHSYGFLSSTVLWKDGKECRMNRPAIQKNLFNHIELLGEGLLSIESATFVGFFVSAQTVREHGLPIQEFFIWGDDIEYTRRLAVRAKLPCYLVGKSRVEHLTQSNEGSNISKDAPERLKRYAYAYRNENYLYRQEGIRGIVYYLVRCGYHFLRIWITAKEHRLLRSGILIKAFWTGWFFHPKIERLQSDSNHATSGEEV